jgi:hypothetical protein
MKIRLILLALATALVMALSVVSAGTVEAGGASRLTGGFGINSGRPVPVHTCINFRTVQSCGQNYTVPNARPFQMKCYKDSAWAVTGLYRSARWFFGNVWNSTNWWVTHWNVWVHSSFVVNQTSVPRC